MSKFRRKYRELTAQEAEMVDGIKRRAEELDMWIEGVPNPRHRALALTKLEEAVMWAVKGVTG